MTDYLVPMTISLCMAIASYLLGYRAGLRKALLVVRKELLASKLTSKTEDE